MKVKKARVCMQCDNVFHVKNETCPHCGDPVSLPLSAFVPSLGGDADERAARESYNQDGPKPGQIQYEDPPRSFFARLWARLMAPFHTEDVEVSA